MATGLLVLLFGEASKLSAVLCADDKTYQARVVFGFSTDTDDAQGNPVDIATAEIDLRSSEKLAAALKIERQRVLQIPPKVSAIKRNGTRSYRLARLGVEFGAEPRTVKVHDLSLVTTGPSYVDLVVKCSKGYYVRSLARDLGEAMQCPAHLGALRRIRNGVFGIELAVGWPITSPVPLLPIADAARLAMQTVDLTDVGLQRARHGKVLGLDDFVQCPTPSEEGQYVAWLYKSELIAIGRFCDETTLRVARGFCSVP